MVLPIMCSFSRRKLAADLVKEIKDEGDLVRRSGMSRARGLQYCKALPVRMQVKVIGEQPEFGELARRPEPGLIGMEGVAGSGIGDHHDLVIWCAIEKFF